jgi:hypothetical protein
MEQGNVVIPDYTRKFNDYHSFWKSEISEKIGTYLYTMGLRSGPLRADLMLSYSLGKFKCLSVLQLHAARSNLCRLRTTSRVDTQRQLQPKVPKPLVLVKAVRKSRTNTRRVDVLNLLISLADLPEVRLTVRAMDIVTPHLCRRESCLLMNKRKRIIGIRLSRNYLK